MKTIRWGIIGVGDVTEVKSGPGFAKANHSALVAVMRRDRAKARDYAKRHGVARWYDDAQALIDDPNVDAISIATPPHVHLRYALMAAAAGKPVYVEKPMALTFAECEQMIAACESAGVPLWIAYYRRALAKFIKVSTLLESDAIGPVHLFSIVVHQTPLKIDNEQLPWRVRPSISGGGLFVDIGAHGLDLIDFLLGPIAEVSGSAVNHAGLYPPEDTVVGQFRLENGVLGTGVWSFTRAAPADLIIIYGARGQIEFSCFDDSPIAVTRDSHTEFCKLPFAQHVQQPLIQTIVDELNGVGRCPSGGASAARTSWVIDHLLAAYRGQ